MSTETEQPMAAWEIELADAEIADLNAEVPCSADYCERPAIWAIYPPCAHVCAGCDPCRAERDAWFLEHPDYTAYCQRCHGDIPLPLTWRPL